jgi:hypothetical protein
LIEQTGNQTPNEIPVNPTAGCEVMKITPGICEKRSLRHTPLSLGDIGQICTNLAAAACQEPDPQLLVR